MGIEIQPFYFVFTRKLLFSLIILLVTCPLLGQGNNRGLTNKAMITRENSPFIKVSMHENKVFFEFDDTLLGKDMLFVRHSKGYKHVIWTKRKNNILLQIHRIKSLSGAIIPIDNNPSIEKSTIGIFPIIKEKSDSKTFYIEVTDLFIKNKVAWYSSFKEIVTPNLSSVNTVLYLQNEIIIKTDRVISKGNIKFEITADFSFFLLPKPMQPRLFDYRIGYVIEDELSAINYYKKNVKASISRWRLEKKYKDQIISEPVKPITFYFDVNVPNKWKPYIKAGILEWLPAFKAAGVKNALQVKELPVSDKNWATRSVNNSMIRWSHKNGIRGSEKGAGSTVSKIVDLRSGEILKSDILIGSSYQRLADKYFIRCSPLDERAQQYPFPDDLMGELIQSLVAHEAGHAFGIKDANYGEYAYPFYKMRDKHWLKHMGHTPSIMNYTRHHNLAQPEDSIPPELLIQKVGPTDIYTITWGYKPFPNISNPQDELPHLEKMIRMQDTFSWYRYNKGQFERIGPDTGNEVADNDDPIKSAELGLKNIKRVIELLPRVTKTQKDNADLKRLYHKTLTLWFNQMQHVMSLIGGYTTQYNSRAQKGAVYTSIPLEIQENAIAFLIDNAFDIPHWLANSKFTFRFQYSMLTDKVMEYQLKLLADILSPLRIKRLEKTAFFKGKRGDIKKILSKLRVGLWKEFNKKIVSVKHDRMELQRAYITLLTEAVTAQKKYAKIKPSDKYSSYSDYSKSLFMSELILLEKNIRYNLKRTKDNSSTHAHLKLCLLDIHNIMSKKINDL